MAYLTLGSQTKTTPKTTILQPKSLTQNDMLSLVKSMAYLKGSKNSKSFSSSPTYSTDRP